MRIIEFDDAPFLEIPFLNAGRGAGQFYEDRLPVHRGRVDRLPDGVSALVVTADLQGRERFQDAPGRPLRLLGETLPGRLCDEVLPELGIRDPERAGVLLAGDFYTVPALDRRGGDGDVLPVWHAFADCFQWVAGVPGNHDAFGDPPLRRPRLPDRMHFLDGYLVELGGCRVAGLGGIIGNTRRPFRRAEDDYLTTLSRLLDARPDVLVSHEGPAGPLKGQAGMAAITDLVAASELPLLIRGHKHWDPPFGEFPGGPQVLCVDARIAILTAAPASGE